MGSGEPVGGANETTVLGAQLSVQSFAMDTSLCVFVGLI